MTKLWVIATDRDCKRCGDVHGYVTQNCQVVCYVSRGTALLVADRHRIPLSNVTLIDPDDAVDSRDLGAYILNITQNGMPDERYPRHASLPSRRS